MWSELNHLMKSARGGCTRGPRGVLARRRARARAIRVQAGTLSHPLGLRLATGQRETRPRFLLGQLVHYFGSFFLVRLGLGTCGESCASWLGVCASSPAKRASQPCISTSFITNRTARDGLALPCRHIDACVGLIPSVLTSRWSPSW